MKKIIAITILIIFIVAGVFLLLLRLIYDEASSTDTHNVKVIERLNQEVQSQTLDPESDQRSAQSENLQNSKEQKNEEIPHDVEERPPYPMIGRDMILTTQAIKSAHLTDDEAVRVQSEIKNLWGKMTDLIAQNVEEDPLRSDPDNGITAFIVSPFGNSGSVAFTQFRSRLIALLGEQRAATLLRSFDSKKHFSGFGKYEMFIKFEPADYADESFRVTFEMKDPETGKKQDGGMGRYSDFERIFGEIFVETTE